MTGREPGRKSPSSAVLIGGLTLCMLACSSLRRVHDCKRVIDTVNGGLSGVSTQDADAAASPMTYGHLADAYDALAKQLEGADSQDATLSKAFAAYRDLILRAAKQSRAFSEELDRPTSTPEEQKEKDSRLATLRNQSKNDANREAALVRKLNSLCHPQ